MSSLVSAIETFSTFAVGQVADWVDVITSQPLLMLFVVALPICGIGVGFLKRLLRA